VSNKQKLKKKRAAARAAGRVVRLTKPDVSAIWRATSAGDLNGAMFIVRDLRPELTVVEARRVAVRISKGGNSPGVTVGSDTETGDWADVSLEP
jgi:hypothetical protein